MKGFVMKITEVLSPVLTGKSIACSPKRTRSLRTENMEKSINDGGDI